MQVNLYITAGKTTLINILTGHISPSAGVAKIFGFDLKEDAEDIKEITSCCPQFDIVWPDLTVEEHFIIFAKVRGINKEFIPRIVEDLLSEVNLKDKRDERICNLSGGMRRRVSIGICTLGNPKVMFFDEPTTGLDPITQKEIMQLILVSITYKHEASKERESDNPN